MSALDSPVISYDHCGTEWSTYGSCCKLESAKQFSIADKQVLELATSGVIKAMTFQKQLLKPIIKDINNWLIQLKHKDQIFFSKKLDILHAIVSSDDSTSHNTCWITELGKLRSSSLCSTCSGRSLDFFKNSRAIVNMDSCSAMLQGCSASIK